MIKSKKRRRSKRSQYSDERIQSILKEYNNQEDITVLEYCKLHEMYITIEKCTIFQLKSVPL